MAISATPLIVDPGGFQRHVALRWTVLGAIVLLGLLLASGSLWRTVPRPVVAAWAAVLLAVAAASATAVDPMAALLGESDRRAGLLSFLVVAGAYAIGTVARPWRRLVLRVAPVVTGCLLVAVGTTLGSQSLTSSRSVLVGNSGQLGGYLIVLAGLSIAVAVHDTDARWRRAGALAAPAALGLVLLTGSYAAVLAGLTLLGATLLSRRTSAPRRWRAGATVGAVALLGTALAWPAQFRSLALSFRGRVDTWFVAVDVVRERPVLGWGPEGFRHGFAHVVPETFVADWGDLRIQDRAHSLVLDQAATAGLLGLATVVLLAAVLFVRVVREGDALDRSLGVTLLAVAVFLMGWFLEFDLAAGLSVVAGLGTAPARPPRHDLATRGLAGACLLGAAAVVVVGAVTVVEDRRFSSALEQVGALQGGADADPAPGTTAEGPDPLQPLRRAAAPTLGYSELLVALEFAPAGSGEQVDRTLDALRQAERWHDPRFDAEVALVHAELNLLLARRAGDPQLLDQAAVAFGHVLDLAPQHSVAWRGLATAQQLRGDPSAELALRKLAALRPRDAGPLHDLAVLQLQLGNVEEAARVLDTACRQVPADEQLAALAEALRSAGGEPRSCP